MDQDEATRAAEWLERWNSSVITVRHLGPLFTYGYWVGFESAVGAPKDVAGNDKWYAEQIEKKAQQEDAIDATVQ